MKKMNNKGFSLVELIVVIAIMAVLIGVLAPQFLRYVEKSRLQKDNQAISEIATATKTAMGNEKVYDSVTGTVTVGTGGGSSKTYSFATGVNTLQGEVGSTVGTQVVLNSKSYTAAPEIQVYIDSDKTVKVFTNAFIEEVNSTAVAKTF